MKLQLTMTGGRVYTSRRYNSEARKTWEDEVISRIGQVQSLAMDVYNANGDVELRTFNPNNIESLLILDEDI